MRSLRKTKNRVRRDLNKRLTCANQELDRLCLKMKIHDRRLSREDRDAASLALASLPRDGSPVRTVNRCVYSGRAHSVYRDFRLSRILLREKGMKGELNGLTKSSW